MEWEIYEVGITPPHNSENPHALVDRINNNGVTIASVDDVNMYPSIKLATARKVVIFFSRQLTAANKKTIKL